MGWVLDIVHSNTWKIGTRSICHSIPLNELGMEMKEFFMACVFVARYSASKSENLSYNFGYKFVHTRSMAMILIKFWDKIENGFGH